MHKCIQPVWIERGDAVVVSVPRPGLEPTPPGQESNVLAIRPQRLIVSERVLCLIND